MMFWGEGGGCPGLRFFLVEVRYLDRCVLPSSNLAHISTVLVVWHGSCHAGLFGVTNFSAPWITWVEIPRLSHCHTICGSTFDCCSWCGLFLPGKPLSRYSKHGVALIWLLTQ